MTTTTGAAFLALSLALQPAPPDVILPTVRPAPQPAPPPVSPVPLPADSLYVVRATVPCTVVASPEGVVGVTSEAGPLKVRAKFVGGTGSYETKGFAEKYLYLVEPRAPGNCELIIVTQASPPATYRVALSVGGVPPGPGPPPADPLVQALAAAYAREPATQAGPDGKATTKARLLANLASLYGVAAPSLTQNPAYTTVGQLGARLIAARKLLVPDNSLKAVRAAVDAELTAKLPSAGAAPLDAPTRAAFAAEWARVAQALGKVQP